MAAADLSHLNNDSLAPVLRARMAAWKLSNPSPLARSPMGLVLKVRCADGSTAVLKCLSEIGQREEGAAARVLSAFGGSGAVRLLAEAPDAILIEHCSGPQLVHDPNGADDAFAVPVICGVIERLHNAPGPRPSGLPTLRERCRALLAPGPDGLPPDQRALFAHGARACETLLADAAPDVLLHGDIHHENIMCGERNGEPVWLAIDPQGVVGERAYEVANLFCNPLGHPEITLDPARPLALAEQLASALSLDADRVLRWGFVHACLSAAWCIEDGRDPSERLGAARLIDTLIRASR